MVMSDFLKRMPKCIFSGYIEGLWQAIIYGNDNSYLKKIIDAGFDGVYLDIIDAFEYFTNDGKWWVPY